jgi:hypothetical protein
VTTAEQVLADLDPVLASDEDFRATFATRRVTRNRLIHYYLRAISERRAVPVRDVTDTAAVPILPRSDPSEMWITYVDPEVLARTSMRIGNFVLVPRESATNLPREPQARIERLSSLDLIAGGRAAEWTVETVASRQQYLAELALTTWPRQPL